MRTAAVAVMCLGAMARAGSLDYAALVREWRALREDAAVVAALSQDLPLARRIERQEEQMHDDASRARALRAEADRVERERSFAAAASASRNTRLSGLGLSLLQTDPGELRERASRLENSARDALVDLVTTMRALKAAAPAKPTRHRRRASETQ